MRVQWTSSALKVAVLMVLTIALVAECKTPFAVKHPRLHHVGRDFRKFCQRMQPIVNFAAGVSNIVMLFVGRDKF